MCVSHSSRACGDDSTPAPFLPVLLFVLPLKSQEDTGVCVFDTAAERAAMAAHLRFSEHKKNSSAPRYSVLLALLVQN